MLYSRCWRYAAAPGFMYRKTSYTSTRLVTATQRMYLANTSVRCPAPSFTGPPCHLNFYKTKRTPFPPFMHICRDSRAALLNFYGQYDFNLKLANNVSEKNDSQNCPAVVFNPHRDIIFLGSPYTRKLTWFQEPQPSEKLDKTSIQKCDTVVIDYRWLLTCRTKRSLLFCLLALMEVRRVFICIESVRRRRRHRGEILLDQFQFFQVESMKMATKMAVKTGIRQKVRDMASLCLEESMKDRYIKFRRRSSDDVEYLVNHLLMVATPRFGFVSLSRDPADVVWDRWKSKSLSN